MKRAYAVVHYFMCVADTSQRHECIVGHRTLGAGEQRHSTRNYGVPSNLVVLDIMDSSELLCGAPSLELDSGASNSFGLKKFLV